MKGILNMVIIFKIECLCCKGIEDKEFYSSNWICRPCQDEIRKVGDSLNRRFKICYGTGKELDVKGLNRPMDLLHPDMTNLANSNTHIPKL